MCKCTWVFLSIKKKFIPTQFSLHFEEKTFQVGLGRKHLSSIIYFPSFFLNQTHSKKVFIPIFSSKFSIYSISPPNKHTFMVCLVCCTRSCNGMVILVKQLFLSKRAIIFLVGVITYKINIFPKIQIFHIHITIIKTISQFLGNIIV